MHDTVILDLPELVALPPPGSVNVRLGPPVEGPGGRWIPCVSETRDGAFLSSLFEVGPARRQVCAGDSRTCCADEALCHAIELAKIAAA